MGSRLRIDRLVLISGPPDALKPPAGGNKVRDLSGALGHKAIITNGIMPEAAVMQRAGHVRCTRHLPSESTSENSETPGRAEVHALSYFFASSAAFSAPFFRSSAPS